MIIDAGAVLDDDFMTKCFEETYNNLMENIYVMGNKINYDWLMESKAQLEKRNSSGVCC